MINRSGTTFVHRAIEETGADIGEIARAYSVTRAVFDLPPLWSAIEALDNQVPTRGAARRVRRDAPVDRPRDALARRHPLPDHRRRRRDRAVPADRQRAWRALPRPDARCRTAGALRRRRPARVARVCRANLRCGSPNCSARSCSSTSSRSLPRPDWTRTPSPRCTTRCPSACRSTNCSPGSPRCRATINGRTLARSAARHDVYAALSAITTAVLRASDDGAAAGRADRRWVAQNVERVERARTTCAPRWTARSPIWRRCRSRCGCCAACRVRTSSASEVRRGDRHPRPHLLARRRAPDAPVQGERGHDRQPAAARVGVIGRLAARQIGTRVRHLDQHAVRLDLPRDVEILVDAARRVHDRVADQLACHEHDVVDAILRDVAVLEVGGNRMTHYRCVGRVVVDR